MPQASDDLRDLMKLMFGEDGFDSPAAEGFLKGRGYNLRTDWQWELPNPDHFITEKELLCLWFLQNEWDYGSVVERVADAAPLT